MAGGEKQLNHFSPCHLGKEYTEQTYLTGQVNQQILFFQIQTSGHQQKEGSLSFVFFDGQSGILGRYISLSVMPDVLPAPCVIIVTSPSFSVVSKISTALLPLVMEWGALLH